MVVVVVAAGGIARRTVDGTAHRTVGARVAVAGDGAGVVVAGETAPDGTGPA